MNPSYGILILGCCYLLGACHEPVIDYNTAIDGCKLDTVHQTYENGGYMDIYLYHASCIVGAQLPVFTDSTMDGKTIDKNYFDGKISVINFWFEGCMPCEAEIPGLNKLVEKYKTENVNFLAIGKNSPTDIEEFLVTHPFHFDHIAYGEPIIRGIFRSTWGYPVTIVANRDQKIIYAKAGGETDSTAIEAIQTALIPVIDGALQ